ncbi:hypothetical protein P389DRAFT_197604 [Cystobasidium minutum MCA 4210]|uniref:uncharacterized protein n=1 Tax=Cystobasidium minutum MCA 4210 TaxID=1397322 RepID=UPI0034CE580F|eukprot:jgi/Rhomi1/197604/gm1.5818_g
MSSSKSKTDLLVRQRFQNPLPPPAFPPKLLTIKTDPSRYATYDFLAPLHLEREVPMIVDSEGGMHLDQNLVPGYWESTDQGRSGAMAPDLSAEADLDDEDLELLVDPPATGAAANSSAAGIMPLNGGGANLDIIGSGARGTNGRTPANVLDKKKKDSIWIKRSEYAIQSDANNALKKEAMVREMAAQRAAQPVVQTPEERLNAILNTFPALDVPLSDVKHPTKPHLQAVESSDILPDQDLWANQYALFKFADNPNERVQGNQPVASSSASTVGLLRPLETEGDESGSNRVAYFIPDDDEVAQSYLTARSSGKTADQELLDDSESAAENASEEYGFRFMRDYDAIRRDTNKEYIFVIEEGQPSQEESSGSVEGDAAAAAARPRRAKGAYYVPLVSHTLLRKRRARKGEARNDYADLGLEFWGGMLVSLGGKEIYPEDEAEARLAELLSVRQPAAAGAEEEEVQEPVTTTNAEALEANGH